MKPVSLEDFGAHVSRMHADRDKWFEMEYSMSLVQSTNQASSRIKIAFYIISIKTYPHVYHILNHYIKICFSCN